MAKRASIRGSVAKPDVAAKADDAAKIAGGLGKPKPTAAVGSEYLDASGQPLMESMSYNLPVELIELYRDLAEERLRIERAEKRELRRAIQNAKRRGETPPADPPPQSRRSASAIVREAMEAYRPQVEAELRALRGEG